MFVQPIVGHYSDRCTSSYGRRRPFILMGAFFVVVAVLTIGFSADIGHLLGDDNTKAIRPRAIVVFIIGFWVLDLANNTLQGPCRALLADYTGKDQRRTRRANAFFSLFMAIGNILGFAAGAYDNWGRWIKFTLTDACGVSCSNLKSAFLLGTVILVFTTFLSVTAAEEIPWRPDNKSNVPAKPTATTPLLADKSVDSQSAEEPKVEDPEDDDEDDEQESEALFWELLVALKHLPRTMWYILLVTALTWFAWFPFLLFDTDWMGREVYNGEPSGEAFLTKLYYGGVRMGSLGLMLNSIVLGLSSLLIDFSCRLLGPSRVWGLGNAIMAVCFAATAIITMAAKRAAEQEGYSGPPTSIIISALLVFALLGAPLAVTYSVPYALTATYAEKSGGGQGLSMGVLNLAVVIPQVVISVGSGPLDALFGGGNQPSFLLGCVSALFGGIAAVFLLPAPLTAFRQGRLRRTRSSPIP